MAERVNVRTACAAHCAMAEAWELISDLLGGTLAMRAKGVRWLPKEPREEDVAYQKRLERSVLYGAFRDTVERLTSRPYSRPLTLKGALPKSLAELPENADLAGQTLQQLARSSFADAVSYGLTHYLIDLPELRGDETRGELLDRRVRPSIVHVPAWDLIGWKAVRNDRGEFVLSQARILERHDEDDGEFGVRSVEHVRVFDAPASGERGTWRLYRAPEGDAKDWALVAQGTHSFPGVPLVTWYTKRTGFMTAAPPLEDLAWLNLEHWQSSSDQRNILRFARVPFLFARGFKEHEKPSSISTSAVWVSDDANANVGWVEHSGAAIAAGAKDLEKIEQRMEVLGLQPLVERTADATATGVRANLSQSMTTIQSWIRNQEQALEAAFRAAATLVDEELPEDFSVDVFSDFVGASGDRADAEMIVQLMLAQKIDHRTGLLELKRRGILAEDVDVEKVIDAVEKQGPSLASIGMGGFGGPLQPPPGQGAGSVADQGAAAAA